MGPGRPADRSKASTGCGSRIAGQAAPGAGGVSRRRAGGGRPRGLTFRDFKSLRRLVTAVATISLLMLAGAPASASERTPVDPSIMQPALNPTFTWECWRIDDKTVCDGERHLSWTAADTGLPCAAGTIYSTGTDDRFLRRWGDAAGRALHSHAVANISETLALQG
jgi:hypothetical protein